MAWSNEQIEEIRVLANEGNPASHIGKHFNVTRNAIVGVCARNKIQLKGGPAILYRTKPAKIRVPRNTSVEKPIDQIVSIARPAKKIEPAPQRSGEYEQMLAILPSVALLDDAGYGCRYSFDSLICCRPSVGRTSYCQGHYSQIYRAKKIPSVFRPRPVRIAAPF